MGVGLRFSALGRRGRGVEDAPSFGKDHAEGDVPIFTKTTLRRDFPQKLGVTRASNPPPLVFLLRSYVFLMFIADE